jgi:hypothetical protein
MQPATAVAQLTHQRRRAAGTPLAEHGITQRCSLLSSTPGRNLEEVSLGEKLREAIKILFGS